MQIGIMERGVCERFSNNYQMNLKSCQISLKPFSNRSQIFLKPFSNRSQTLRPFSNSKNVLKSFSNSQIVLKTYRQTNFVVAPRWPKITLYITPLCITPQAFKECHGPGAPVRCGNMPLHLQFLPSARNMQLASMIFRSICHSQPYQVSAYEIGGVRLIT